MTLPITVEHKRVAVIGGGIAGLATAYRLTKQYGLDTTLLEASDRLGGVVQTTPKDGYLLEHGVNGFLSDPSGVMRIAGELGLTIQHADVSAKRRFLFTKGELQPVPRSPKEFLRSKILTLSGKLRLLLEPLFSLAIRRKRRLSAKKNGVGSDSDQTVYDFFDRRFGKQVADNVASAFVVGVFAGDPKALSLPACFPKLDTLDKKGSFLLGAVSRGRAPRAKIVSLPQGMESVTKALARVLPSLLTNTKVLELKKRKNGIAVVTNKDEMLFDAVVLATPAASSAGMIQSYWPTSYQHLCQIEYVAVAVVHLGFDSDAVSHIPKGFGFLVPTQEGHSNTIPSDVADGFPLLGVVFESDIWPGRAPAGKRLFRCMLGGSRRPNILDQSDDSLIAEAINALGLAAGEVGIAEMQHVVRWPKAIPQYGLGHRQRLQEIRKELEPEGIFVVGAAHDGPAVNACVRSGTIEAQKVAKLLQDHVAPNRDAVDFHQKAAAL